MVMVQSELPAASRVRPSAKVPKATELTGLVWPVRGWPMGVPVVGSQSRTVPSVTTRIGLGRTTLYRNPTLRAVIEGSSHVAAASCMARSAARPRCA
jgi:hypothetical protein